MGSIVRIILGTIVALVVLIVFATVSMYIIGALALAYVDYRSSAEGFACSSCDDLRFPPGGRAALNPYVWPYSGTPCVPEYEPPRDEKPKFIHQTTPDHVPLE